MKDRNPARAVAVHEPWLGMTAMADVDSPIEAAERELGAFLAAVRRRFGASVVVRAADAWIEALEAIPSSAGLPRPGWRAVTILAASRVANEVLASAS